MPDYSKGTSAHRVQILLEGAKLTGGDRDKTYGPPVVNLGLAGFLKRMYWENVTRQMSDAEHEAIDQVLTKLARIGTGVYHEDNYIDMATYAAIAGEVGALAENAMQGQAANAAVKKALEAGETSNQALRDIAANFSPRPGEFIAADTPDPSI